MNDGASSSRRGGCGETVLIDHGQLRSSCGYCRSNSYTSISHGLWAQSIKANDYQDLLDRGWRRSGCFLYKPEMESTCCPPYTIRLKACDFVPSREQVRVQKKMQRFVEGTLNLRKPDQHQEMSFTECNINSCNNESLAITSSGISSGKSLSGKNEKKFNEDEFLQVLANGVNNAISACIDRGEFPSSIQFPTAVVKKVKLQAKRKLTEDLLYTSSIPFQIAASLKRAQSAQGKNLPAWLNALSQNGGSLDITPNIIAEMLSSSIKLDGKPFDLFVKACNGHLNFYSSTEQSEYSDLVLNTEACTQTLEGVRGKNKETFSTESSANIPFKKKKLEIRMKRSSFDPDEFALYKRYQIEVHGDLPDKVTESSYRRFLVDTPIIFVPPSGTKSVPPCGFGSFHQQYVIDGKIVAVGVVDILPRCLSSKYLFWDPDLAFLSLGKYSALQEISWVKNSHDHCPSFQHYYLGYYIHSCNKMIYKAAYRPSELLCPLRYEWVPFDIARPLLDKKSYVVLSDFKTQHYQASSNGTSSYPDYNGSNRASRDEKDEAGILNDDEDKSKAEDNGEPLRNELMVYNIDNILIDLQGSRLRFKNFRQLYGPIDKGLIRELELHLGRFMRVVGNELSDRIIYSLE